MFAIKKSYGFLNVGNQQISSIIRKYTKYCARCRKRIDIPYKDWHLPFCMRCRLEITKAEKDKINVIITRKNLK